MASGCEVFFLLLKMITATLIPVKWELVFKSLMLTTNFAGVKLSFSGKLKIQLVVRIAGGAGFNG